MFVSDCPSARVCLIISAAIPWGRPSGGGGGGWLPQVVGLVGRLVGPCPLRNERDRRILEHKLRGAQAKTRDLNSRRTCPCLPFESRGNQRGGQVGQVRRRQRRPLLADLVGHEKWMEPKIAAAAVRLKWATRLGRNRSRRAVQRASKKSGPLESKTGAGGRRSVWFGGPRLDAPASRVGVAPVPPAVFKP